MVVVGYRGGVAGIAAFVLTTITFMTGGSMPASTSSTARIVDYISSHRSALLATTALSVVLAALVVWFAATLARLLYDSDEHSPLGLIVLAAGAGMAVMMSLDGVTLTALALVSKQPGGLTDPSVVRLFYDLENGIIMPGAFGCLAAIFLLAAGCAMVRHKFAAPWLGWLSLALAPFAAAGSIVGLTATSGGTSVFGFLPAISSGIVLLISSIFMLRGRAGGEVARAPARMPVTATS